METLGGLLLLIFCSLPFINIVLLIIAASKKKITAIKAFGIATIGISSPFLLAFTLPHQPIPFGRGGESDIDIVGTAFGFFAIMTVMLFYLIIKLRSKNNVGSEMETNVLDQ